MNNVKTFLNYITRANAGATESLRGRRSCWRFPNKQVWIWPSRCPPCCTAGGTLLLGQCGLPEFWTLEKGWFKTFHYITSLSSHKDIIRMQLPSIKTKQKKIGNNCSMIWMQIRNEQYLNKCHFLEQVDTSFYIIVFIFILCTWMAMQTPWRTCGSQKTPCKNPFLLSTIFVLASNSGQWA